MKKIVLTEIEFRIGKLEYKVVRGIKPNKFEITAMENCGTRRVLL